MNIIFLAPYLLFALLLVPLAWFFLKTTPPQPKEQSFPAIRLLYQLHHKGQEAVKSPWWLILLRLFTIILLIIGLAQPVYKSKNTALNTTSQPILLIIDNGWASAPQWAYFMNAAKQLIEKAQQQNSHIQLLLTAPDEQNHPLQIQPAPPTTAQLNGLHPVSWSVDHQQVATLLQKTKLVSPQTTIYYFSDHIQHPDDTIFQQILKKWKNIYEIHPSQSQQAAIPILLQKITLFKTGLTQRLSLLPQPTDRTIQLQAYNKNHELISSTSKTIPALTKSMDVDISIPLEARNNIHYLKINHSSNAGSIYLLGEKDRTHNIGLFRPSDSANTPFTGSLYYLKKALSPMGDLQEGSIDQLLQHSLSVIILPDTSITDPNTIKKLEDWIKNGGMLIRFSGPLLANSTLNQTSAEPDLSLLPLPLLAGSRELGGAMTWEKPQTLAPFPTNSPFHDLKIPPDVHINQQLLVRPSNDLSQYCWATLQDGTPLVTHRPIGKGQIVLFHTNSTADWSSLPLSGLFVSMLDKLVDISFGVQTPNTQTLLHPITTLNAEGLTESPSPYVQPIQADQMVKTTVSPIHPPGIYGSEQFQSALNIGDTLPSLIPSSPIGKVVSLEKVETSISFSSIFILFSLILMMIDFIASLWLRGQMRYRKTLMTIIFVSCCFSPAVYAEPNVSPAASLETRLGYILTNDSKIDTVSKQGLTGLSQFINSKTTLSLSPPDGVDPTKDDLAFYPLLYWPITANVQPDSKRTEALNYYINHGGILVLDTQGHDPTSSIQPIHPELFAGEASGTAQALKNATEGLSIPTLSPISDKHLLSRTFYILKSFPGRYDAMPVWASKSDPLLNDGISSIIIGENDWAHAWAGLLNDTQRYALFPNTEQQRNLSYRFGVNLVMYALTGSYKADQFHVSALLKQLGAQE